MKRWSEVDLLNRLRENPQVQVQSGLDDSTPDAPPLSATDVQMRGDLAAVAAEPDFRSQVERRAWRWVDTMEPVLKAYEPLVLRMPGGNYKPDFGLLMPDARLWLIEVKGKGSFRAHRSGRSSKKALREAAHYFSWLAKFWVLIERPKKEGGGWHFEGVEPRRL